jgi:hypothetical protein
MKRHLYVPALVLTAFGLAGCAALLQGDRLRPEPVARRGLEALERQEFDAAITDLTWVATHFLDRSVGKHALLALAVAELDPGNPGRRPEEGAEHLARFRRLTDWPPWTVPVANALRGLALEVRDAEARARRAERAARRAVREAREATARADEAGESERNARTENRSLRTRMSRLEAELQETREQLEEARVEVERMRRILGS